MEVVYEVAGVLLPFHSTLLNATLWLVTLAVGSEALKRLMGPGFNVRGKHVFITGGSSGLGKAVALKYAKAGADVTLVSRSKAKLERARDEVVDVLGPNAGAKVCTVSCDVTSYDAVAAALKQAEELQGRVPDVIICSAGLSFPGYFTQSTVQAHEQQMQLNYFGTLYTIKAAPPR